MSSRRFTEAELVERPALDLLAELGWTVLDAGAEVLGPAGTLGRDSIHEVILTHRLRDALWVLNPAVPDDTREEALTAVTWDRANMDPTRANQEIHELLRDGYRLNGGMTGVTLSTPPYGTSISPTQPRTAGWRRRRCGSPVSCTAGGRT